MTRIAPLMFLAALTAVPASPQSVSPGERVRVDAPGVGDGMIIGILRAARADGLRVQLEGRDWAMEVPLRQVRSLWVSRGTRSKAALGAVIGALAGAAVGYALHNEQDDVPGEGDGRGLSMGFGAAGGAVVGGLLGNAFKSERWAPVDLHAVRVTGSPPPLRVTIRF